MASTGVFSGTASMERPELVIYLQLGRRGALIGITNFEGFLKPRKRLPEDWYQDYVIIFERPSLKAELMDMIRLCASLNVELRVISDDEDIIKGALRDIGGPGSKVRMKVYRELEQALEGLLVIGLTRYAELNEEDLIELLRRCSGSRVGFLIGNEYEGLSLRARALSHYLVRLGPETGLSMRSSTAASYVLGLVTCLKMMRKGQTSRSERATP